MLAPEKYTLASSKETEVKYKNLWETQERCFQIYQQKGACCYSVFLNHSCLTEQLAKRSCIQCMLYLLHVEVNCKKGLKSVNLSFGILPPMPPYKWSFLVLSGDGYAVIYCFFSFFPSHLFFSNRLESGCFRASSPSSCSFGQNHCKNSVNP